MSGFNVRARQSIALANYSESLALLLIHHMRYQMAVDRAWFKLKGHHSIRRRKVSWAAMERRARQLVVWWPVPVILIWVLAEEGPLATVKAVTAAIFWAVGAFVLLVAIGWILYRIIKLILRLMNQLSGKNPRLNPKSENPEKPASSSDAGNSEFNTLTLEVNPKAESGQAGDMSAMLGGTLGGMLGGLFNRASAGHDFWEDAPAWANYWAMDMDGVAFWYEKEPEKEVDFWLNVIAGRVVRDRRYPVSEHWENSLIRRPGIQEQQS